MSSLERVCCGEQILRVTTVSKTEVTHKLWFTSVILFSETVTQLECSHFTQILGNLGFSDIFLPFYSYRECESVQLYECYDPSRV